MEKVYIFVSHSHADLETVRVIRNYLESLDAEPILFFLKSKNDKDEIIQLIKDEIDARVWFIYCKSSNAEQSKWVKEEREYVKLTGKRNITIDIDNCLDKNGKLNEETKEKLNLIVNGFRNLQQVFISSSPVDQKYTEMIIDLFLSYGIRTFENSHILKDHSANFSEFSKQIIEESDFFVLLMSEASSRSSIIKKEFEYAFKNRKIIFPVIIDDGKTDLQGIVRNNPVLETYQLFIFDVTSEYAKKQSIHKLIDAFIDYYIIRTMPL